MMNEYLYLDNAATTRMLPEVKSTMRPYMDESYGNPSAGYELGRRARCAVESAREQIASCLLVHPKEIYFTSGGSESNNWAIKCSLLKGRHGITSAIEHEAVLECCRYLERQGREVTYLPVDYNGVVKPLSLESAIMPHTDFVSIMMANNEIGTIEPIHELAKIARKKGIRFHTDAVQAIGQIPVFPKELGVDMLSASAHKFHGPKGVGFLYIEKGKEIESFVSGGGQERGRRAGTENVAGIVGMAKALQMAMDRLSYEKKKQEFLRDYFIKAIFSNIDGVRLNGDPKVRLPGNINISFKGVKTRQLLVLLEENGILASAGSACSTGEKRTSHVITAIGVPNDYAMGSVRFSMGYETTKEQLDYVAIKLKECVETLRKSS